MIFRRKSLLNTLMQIFIMLRHLVAEISHFKVDDYRVFRTGASDLILFLGGVYIAGKMGVIFLKSFSRKIMTNNTQIYNDLRLVLTTGRVVKAPAGYVLYFAREIIFGISSIRYARKCVRLDYLYSDVTVTIIYSHADIILWSVHQFSVDKST